MNIITRKRRSRKGVSWIKHKFSVWYRRKLALSLPLVMSAAAKAHHQLMAIKATPAKTKLEKTNKKMAVAELSLAAPKAMSKAYRYFIDN